jgi:hypothetical protein
MTCNPEEAGIGGKATVAVHDIGPEHYESSQYTLVERVCEFLEQYAIEFGGGTELLQSSQSTIATSPKNACV